MGVKAGEETAKDSKGAKGAKAPLKTSTKKANAELKDLADLESMHGAGKTKWSKTDWMKYSKLMKIFFWELL